MVVLTYCKNKDEILKLIPKHQIFKKSINNIQTHNVLDFELLKTGSTISSQQLMAEHTSGVGGRESW